MWQSYTLPHAFIVSGVEGAGKTQLSTWLSRVILCQADRNDNPLPCEQCKSCHLTKQYTHPDLHIAELQGNNISVEQVRAISRFLEKKAQLGTSQVVIIYSADKMTESASNALLKTLEEPTPNSYIILQVADAQRLLPTIVSRCQTITIRPPVGEKLAASLSLGQSDPFSNLTHIAELSSETVAHQFEEVKQCFVSFVNSGANRMQLFNLCLQNEHSIRWLEKFLVDVTRANATWPTTGNEAINSKVISNEKVWQCYALVKSYNRHVVTKSQFNKEFGLEKLLSEMQNVIFAQET